MDKGTFGSRRRQRGLALITAVLVVAIVATVATTLALGEQVWFRQAQNMTDRAQAISLRQGALNYAAILLARDDVTVDHLDELWAKPLPPLPVEGGMIAFKVDDAQGLFNLNNVVQAGQPNGPNMEMFRRLLISRGLDPGLSETLRDWLDPDSTAQGGGEDTEYLSLPQPYRAANQLLQSVDELRLVKGFNAKAVEKLRPYVIALPVPTTVNINTAPGQVLAALCTNLSAAAVKPVLDSRETQPFKSSGEFTARLPSCTLASPTTNLHDIKTSYFLVTIDIRYGRLQRQTLGLIKRTAGKATVEWHQLPPLKLEADPDEKT